MIKLITTIFITSSLLVACGGDSASTSTNAATGGAASGTLTISGDAILPSSVTITTADHFNDAFSEAVVFKEVVGSGVITITIALAHDGVPASAFPSVNVLYAEGGATGSVTQTYNWFVAGATTGTAGLTHDAAAKSFTFNNVQIAGGSIFDSAGASTSLTTTVTLDGTATY
jgi:hypothetical protein